jgi:hypothetical protein
VLGLAMHVGLIVLIDFADLSLGMVMLHLFTFDGVARVRYRLLASPQDACPIATRNLRSRLLA